MTLPPAIVIASSTNAWPASPFCLQAYAAIMRTNIDFSVMTDEK
jgi:hypothetical protein